MKNLKYYIFLTNILIVFFGLIGMVGELKKIRIQ